MSAPPVVFAKGDAVKVTTGGRSARGSVILASPCGKSLALEFDAMLNPSGGLGGYPGQMPVMWSDELSRFEDLICSLPVAIERA